MSFKALAFAAIAAGTVSIALPASAAELVHGAYYGNGNNYAPGNWTVVTSSEGIENGLRAHVRFPPTAAPAPVGNVYTFALGELLSLDWSFDNVGNFLTVGPTSTLTFTNAAGGTVSYDALNLAGNDNAHFFSTGGQQNSLQIAWLNPTLNYNANVNGTYFVDFTTTNALTQTATNRIVIQQGAGFSGAVPEPATWAMMIMGFGLTGAMMRRRPTVYA